MSVTYKNEEVDYTGWQQPESAFVIHAEEEREGEEVTWSEIHARAWELESEHLAYERES